MDDNENYHVLSFDDALQLARLLAELDRLLARSEAAARAETGGEIEVWVDFAPIKGNEHTRHVYTTQAAYAALAASGLGIESIGTIARERLPATVWRLTG